MGTTMYNPKTDERFQQPFIDIDEWRERELVDGTVLPYRYMHGGFQGTNVKFSFFFPEVKAYQGRFHQYLSPFPGPDEEMASIGRTGENDRVAFALSCGAYFIESNMGSCAAFGGMADPTIVWQSSAAAAEYSREKAEELYHAGRPYGYVYGGSGGGYKTLACIENTNTWDGAAPYVIGSPVSLPNTITMHVQGQRVLRNCFDKILDALDEGGSGNPYEQLNPEETAMLEELTKMGFPPIAWYLEAKGEINDGSLPVLAPGVKAADPTYFEEFWTKEGYMGADPDSTAVRDRLQFTGIIKSVNLPTTEENQNPEDGLNGVDDAWKKQLVSGNGAWIELEELPGGEDLYLHGVNLIPQTGAAVGQELLLDKMIPYPEGKGGYLTIGMCYGMSDLREVLSGIQPGDTLYMDNSDYIAIQSYYRHQCPSDLSFHAWDQFRNPDGTPSLPQRDNVMGYGFTGTGTVQDGNIQGKVILTQALMDESTCPWCADWYRRKVIETKGSEQDFRVYYTQRVMHGDVDTLVNYMVVDYMGSLCQALIDLANWAEKGIEPLPSTDYTLNEDGQIYLNPDITKRRGIQADVIITVNGQKCAHVKVKETVNFEIHVEVPKGAGEVTEILMTYEELEGVTRDTMYPVTCEFTPYEKGQNHCAKATASTTYQKPGTYFAVTKILSNRHGNRMEQFTQIKNMDRVRIIVE